MTFPNTFYRIWRFGHWALLPLLLMAAGRCAHAQNGTAPPGGPEVRVEYFGAERGYVVGMETVNLLCLVRNVGAAALPERRIRLRCYAASGLDYTSGETLPFVPPLGRNELVAFRWRLQPDTEKSALVAAVLIEDMGAAAALASGPIAPPGSGPHATPASAVPVTLSPGPVVLSVIPRFQATPRYGSPPAAPNPAPRAAANSNDAWISNETLTARAVVGQRGMPLLLLSGREGGVWQPLAVAPSLGSVRSGEEGQRPWWETFRWTGAKSSADATTATLTLTGTCGARWRAELILTAQAGTAAMEGRLRLIARQTLRCYGVELPRLLVPADPARAAAVRADGSALTLPSEEPPLSENAPVAARKTGSLTFGIAWPTSVALADWRWSRLAEGDERLISVLGAEWSEPGGSLVLPGGAIEFPFRLFAIASSGTIRDALRFVKP